MIRVLHTGDWHVGRALSRVSRLEETREVLAEVVAIAVRESVDAVVVCGDVFEHLSPSAEAEQVGVAAGLPRPESPAEEHGHHRTSPNRLLDAAVASRSWNKMSNLSC